jgi:uncharacterized protein
MRFAGAVLLFSVSISASEYTESIEKWRQEREARLKSPGNWLSLAGLFWMKPGENLAGSDPSAPITLPKSAPARVGTFTLTGDTVTFRPASGKPVTLAPDTDEFVEAGGVKLSVIHRGSRFGIRIRDDNSVYRTKFTKLDWFPIDPSWRIDAKYTPLPRSRTTFFDSITGDKQEMTIPGVVEFTREGKTYRMSPVLEGDELFFVLRDQTAGKSTYPAARFLYAKLPKKAGPIEIDFNKAYNPPCAFTPYATCPLPPKENRLPIAVEAGEKLYRGTVLLH